MNGEQIKDLRERVKDLENFRIENDTEFSFVAGQILERLNYNPHNRHYNYYMKEMQRFNTIDKMRDYVQKTFTANSHKVKMSEKVLQNATAEIIGYRGEKLDEKALFQGCIEPDSIFE